MPKTSTGGLKGGRALYRSKDAYASQGFENDTRQSQLGALLIANVQGDSLQSITAGTENVVLFPSRSLSRITPPAVFSRGFIYDNAGAFFCRAGGTFKFAVSLRLTDLAVNTLAQATLQIVRGQDIIRFTFTNVNTDAVNTNSFVVQGSHYVDLLPGDVISLLIDPGNTTTLRGTTEATNTSGGLTATVRQSYFSLEQIDLPAPMT